MKRRRMMLGDVFLLWLAHVAATTLLGCGSYDDLVKEFKDAGLPVVSAIVPESAKTGDVVTVRGSNFGSTPGRLGFQDANGNVAVAEIASWNPDFIVTKVPSLAGSPASSAVHLVTSDGNLPPVPSNFTVLR